MNRGKKLVKNTIILAIGQLSSKIFTFLLIPIYTALLTPEDFGRIDAIQTVVSLSMYFVTLQIENSIFRFLIENRNKRKNQNSYVTNGYYVLTIMSVFFTILILIINLIHKLDYIVIIILLIWAQGFYLYSSNFARGLGKNIDYSIASFVVTLTSLVVNILFIVIFKMGGISIIFALLISNFIGTLYYVIRIKIWEYIDLKLVNRTQIKEMLDYSLPLIPNAISWWISNASDRILIMIFLGASFNGVYAAANKIPTIYTTLFNIFNIAWSESVSLSINDEDKTEYINKAMNSSLKFFSFINLLIILFSSLMFNILIGEKYYNAYNHIYILSIALFINSICSMLGGILTGLMNTKVIGWTTALGAIVNAIINLLFIKKIGLYAASLSTLASYIVILYFRYKEVEKNIDLKLEKKYLLEIIFITILISLGYFLRNIYINIILLFILLLYGWEKNKPMIKSIFNYKKFIRRKII